MSELPKGWAGCRLDEISAIITGKTPSKKNAEYFGGSIPFIKPGDVNNQGFIEFTQETLTELGAKTVPIIPKNSITVTCIGNLGRVGITTKESVTNQQINTVVVNPLINYRFIYHYIRTLKHWMESEASATTVSIINKSKFSAAPVYLAPLNEQIRIADKLDSILAKVNKAQLRLDKIPAILKRFRQSVLAAATSGELTKEWRNNQDYNQVIINNLDDENDPYNVWNKSKNKKIPEGWLYCKLYQLGKIQGGGTPSKSKDEYWGGEIPWVTPKDMKIDFIANSKLTVTSKGVDESSAKLIKDGSVMFVVRGMILAHSFPVAINEKMVTVNQDMKCITPSDFVDSKYLLFSLKSLKDLFVELASSSTHGTKRLESKMYRNVAISIPPMSEQIEIVKQVESLFMMADTVEKKYLEAKSRLDRLTSSILAKAFRGELVSQNDKDEPAEALLKRIKAEVLKVKSNKK